MPGALDKGDDGGETRQTGGVDGPEGIAFKSTKSVSVFVLAFLFGGTFESIEVAVKKQRKMKAQTFETSPDNLHEEVFEEHGHKSASFCFNLCKLSANLARTIF